MIWCAAGILRKGKPWQIRASSALALVLMLVVWPLRLFAIMENRGESCLKLEVPAGAIAADCMRVLVDLDRDRAQSGDKEVSGCDTTRYPSLARLRPVRVLRTGTDQPQKANDIRDRGLILELDHLSAYVFGYDRDSGTWLLRISYRESGSTVLCSMPAQD